MGFYAKKIFQTAPVTSVTESTLESNSDVNVPTIKAVMDGLGRKQLLINNDFQCWQRGDILDIPTNKTSLCYLPDMWGVWGNDYAGRLEKVENGLKVITEVTTAYVMQNLDYLNLTVGKTYTIVTSVNNVIYSKSFQYGDIFKDDKIGIIGTSGNCYLLVRMLKNNDIVNYCDLFEGDIAYPHVKEDYAIALLRCQEYVIIGDFNLSTIYRYSDKRVMLKGFFKKMNKTPTLNLNSVATYNSNGTTMVANNITYQIYSMMFVVDATFSENIQNGNSAWVFAELSCEPL